MIDLKTNYLGLQLRTPWWLQPHRYPSSWTASAASRCWRFRRGVVFIVRRAVAPGKRRARQHLTEGTDSFAEGIQLFPSAR